MKAITQYQPWASLVAIKAKRVETRSWDTMYRGPLAIHAAKAFAPAYRVLAYHQEPFRSVLAAARLIPTQAHGMVPEGLPLGVIVAVCELDVCRRIVSKAQAEWELRHFCPETWQQEKAFGDYAPGRYMWMLVNIRPLCVPIPARGFQRLWEWEPPADLEERLK